MPTCKPDITPLEDAVTLLREGLARHRGDEADDVLRDGLLRRFSSAYEIGHRTLKRYLEHASASSELIRLMPSYV